ncbi:MAG TPA: hypothetical protein VHY83_12265 [Solirubrobacteraceae bacterium]|jgi:hypothetical protein|nr:hypothetical protein [Solirubrobacteraceae bacterium]
MYHLQLRQFPHNLCRFNLSERELAALLAPWVLEKPLELGERKWSPHEATLTVLEGPQLELQQLSMGRGWRAAERHGQDVTARVTAAAGQALAGATGARSESEPQPPQHSVGAAAPISDPLALGVQLASLLGDDPGRLLAAWREASAEQPGLTPSETLALAEAALGSPRTPAGGPDDR